MHIHGTLLFLAQVEKREWVEGRGILALAVE